MAAGDYPIDRDELLARIDLAQVLDALATGHGEGHKRTWNCPEPDHPDVHPSVTIQADRHGTQRWRCWSGGHGGTAIDVVVAARGMPVGDAIRWLDDNYARLRPIHRDPPSPERAVGDPAPEVVEYVERCAKLLWTPAGRPVREWLNGRGYPDDVLALNKVGADPGRRYLPRPKGFPAGWPAAVYPALDHQGAVTYFQARYLEPPQGRGKYDNPSSRWAANPRLGWVRPTASGRRAGRCIVVTEGLADALAAARLGHDAVGVLGTAAFDRRAAQLVASSATQLGRPIVVCFDADVAGEAGASRLVRDLRAAGMEGVRTVSPPSGSDLTDWVIGDAPSASGALAGPQRGGPPTLKPPAAGLSLT